MGPQPTLQPEPPPAPQPAPNRVRDASWPWRTDFATLEAGERRAARYALQMVARCRWLQARFGDDDFLKPFWDLTRCLFDPDRLARLKQRWMRPDTPSRTGEAAASAEDPLAFLRARRVGNHGNPWWIAGGVAGARMRRDLIGYFRRVPPAVIERLAAADGVAPTRQSIGVLADCVGLEALEWQLLDFVEKRESVQAFPFLLRETGTLQPQRHLECLAAAFGCSVQAVLRCLEPGRPLMRLGLLKRARLAPDLEDFLETGRLLPELLQHDPATREELLEALIEPAPAAAHGVADFPHLAQEAARLVTVLKETAGTRAAGINVLLYGTPGSGKTQFAMAVAAAAGRRLYCVRCEIPDGQAMSRRDRLGAYQLSQALLCSHNDAVLLFDEAEDVFADQVNTLALRLGAQARAHGEKAWMNHLLEDNPLPTIWVTNAVRAIDPAFRRRFLLPVAFATPPRRVRRKMVREHLGEAALPAALPEALPEALLEELAADERMTPASFDSARRLLALCRADPPEQVVREGVAAARRLLHGTGLAPLRRPAIAFDVAYLNLAGGIAPGRLAEALARSGRGALCFYGPPGTGKTEFAHVLADALDRELVVKASSDLVSAYVGETERNIARLFNELDAEHSVLLLDEVDSLLRDRGQAQRSWELTQVNELLQQMERFNGIFIAATNLMTELDAAAMRRFDFKLEFRPLTEAQRLALFAREALGDASAIDAIPAPLARRLASMSTLTPGDFANVVRQRTLLGEALSAEAFLRALIQACKHKRGMGVAA